MSQFSSWFVITGAPGSGKTTLINELNNNGFATMPEVARLVIDERLASGQSIEDIRRDEAALQQAIVARRFELQSHVPIDQITIFDRGMHDSLAYLRYYHFEEGQRLLDACSKISYGAVFMLEPLAQYEQDYGRTEDADFAAAMHELLIKTYSDYGMQPVLVPNRSVPERVDMVMRYIDNRSH